MLALITTKSAKRYTPEEYLALEEKAEFRSEYINGYIFEMAGGRESLKIRFCLLKFCRKARKNMTKTTSFLLIKTSNRFKNTF